MTASGRIGVLIPAVRDALDADLLKGIHTQAKKLGYDVLVFTNASNSLKEYPLTDYVKGEENIYALAEAAQLDGMLFAAGRFRNDELIERLLERLQKTNIPCIVLERRQEEMPCLFPPQREGMRQITAHLIEEHDCRTLYCLTGWRGNPDAEERLSGFIETLEAHGIHPQEEWLIYGDFWKESASHLAKQIAEGKLPCPDAVVCANDTMALALCEALQSHGIHVPDQIRVTGYDGSLAASMSEPMLTTVCGKDELLGQTAVARLHGMLHPDADPVGISAEISVKFGTSCGCTAETAASSHRFNKTEYMERDFLYNCTYREYYMTSNFIGQLSEAESLSDFSRIADSLAYLLPHWERLDICLCEDWLGDFEHPEVCRESGYPRNMRLLLSKKRDGNAPDGYKFLTSQLLPALRETHEPEFIVCTPLHCRNQVLGYCALSYKSAKKFLMEERYHNWCDAAANGLRSLKNKLYIDYMQEKMARYAVRDPISGMYNRKGLLQEFPAFYASCQQKAVFLLLVSWNHTIVSSAKHTPDDGMLMANVMQMACKPDELCARIGEKTFAILQHVPLNADVKAWTDKKVLQLVHLLKSIQGQTAVQMPELVTDSVPLAEETDFEAALDRSMQKLTETMRNAGTGKTDYSAQLVRIRLEMRLMPQFAWDAESIAAELLISKSYFQRLYRQQFSSTFTDDLITARLDKAKELLKTTNLRIQEIAEQCGYENQSHFMRQFKDRIGITAIQYRKQ